MHYFRVELDLETAILTPIHSGTLFGQLCWSYRTLHSEKALATWLSQQEEAPFLLSGAMPRGFLPRPLLAPMPRREKLSLGEVQDSKKLRRRPWVLRKDFEAIREGISEGMLMQQLKLAEVATAPAMRTARRAHNTIDRRTGTTPAEGGLYFVDESWPSEESGSGRCDVYVGTEMDEVAIRKLFEFTGTWGFGRDASTGRGRWSCTVHRESGELFGEKGARRMSLSHGSLTANMAEPRYKLHVHFGKVGGGYGITSSPFKYPLTLLRPGATFRPSGAGLCGYGELLRDVHPEKPWIVHHARHLTVGFTEATNG